MARSLTEPQRAIPPIAIDLQLNYGSSTTARGGESFFFGETARRRVLQDLGKAEARRLERLLNTYAVVSDSGTLITTAWRTRRLRRS
jgi:hypothetical protein